MEAIGVKNNNPRYSSRPFVDENCNESIIKTDIRKNAIFTLNGNPLDVIKVEDIQAMAIKDIDEKDFNFSFTAIANITYKKGNGYETKQFNLSGKYFIEDSTTHNRANIIVTPR